MKTVDPNFLARARDVFVSVGANSLQHLRDEVAVHAVGTARRDMLSALDTASRLFGRPLATIPATSSVIRELFSKKSGPELGVSAKRLANVRSDVIKALSLFGTPVAAITTRIPLAPDWSALLGAIDVPHHLHALRRLACFCTAMRIAPAAVGYETLLGFHTALEAEEIVKNPRKLLKSTIAIWNMCQRAVPEWPAITLSSPFKTKPYTLPLSDFPESFQWDVASWVTRVTDADPTDDDAPARPLRPATIKNRVVEFRRFASALVHLGDVTVEDVVGLHVFFEDDHFKSGLRFFLKRFDNKPTAGIEAMANHLRHVARHHCKVDADTFKALTKICERLNSRTPRQMSRGNRELLRQFDDPMNVAELLAFSDKERARGLKQRNPVRAAKCFERALVVEILIHCCLRMQNLRTIHLTNNLRQTGGKMYLSFEAKEVKNDQVLEFKLPEELAKAMIEFITIYRPRLPGADGPYLFPGENGGPRSGQALREALDTLRKHSGLNMHPHLFRHAIAKIVVERNPDLYPAISKHLGHTRLDMTMAHYLGTEGRAAARHIDSLLRNARINPKLKKD